MFNSEDEIESGTNDATSDSSSAPETNSESQTNDNSAQASASAKSENVPFHEHPRFKELIEERKTYATQLEEMRAQLEALRQPKQEPVKQVSQFAAKLKEIDPAYGEWAEKMESTASQIEKFEAWQRDQQTQQLRTQYESSMDKLHSDSKTPDNLKDFVRQGVEAEIRNNPKLGMKDLPGVYKNVSEKYTSLLEGIKRAERASYVKDKTKDSSAPAAMSKGKAPSHSSKSEYGNDREANLALIAKKALKLSRAENDI